MCLPLAGVWYTPIRRVGRHLALRSIGRDAANKYTAGDILIVEAVAAARQHLARPKAQEMARGSGRLHRHVTSQVVSPTSISIIVHTLWQIKVWQLTLQQCPSALCCTEACTHAAISTGTT